MPIQFNRQSQVHVNQDRIGIDQSQVSVDKSKQTDATQQVQKADIDPQMATADVKATVGDATRNNRVGRRSAGSRGAVAGLAPGAEKPEKKGPGLFKKAVMGVMIGVMAMSLVGCGNDTPDPGPPGGATTQYEQVYDQGQQGNGLEGRAVRGGSPLQIQMDNMGGGGARDVRTPDAPATDMQAPAQNINPNADRGPTPGSNDVETEINYRVDVEVRTGYVNANKTAELGVGGARLSRSGAQVQQAQPDLTPAQQQLLDAENGVSVQQGYVNPNK